MDQSMFDGFSYTSETFKYPFNVEESDIMIDHHHFCADQQQQQKQRQISSSEAIRLDGNNKAEGDLDDATGNEEEHNNSRDHHCHSSSNPDEDHNTDNRNRYQGNNSKRTFTRTT